MKKVRTVYYVDYKRGIVLKGLAYNFDVMSDDSSQLMHVFSEENVNFSERNKQIRISEVYINEIDADISLNNYFRNVVEEIKNEINNVSDIIGLLLKYDATKYHHEGTQEYFESKIIRTAVEEKAQELGIHINYDFSLMKII